MSFIVRPSEWEIEHASGIFAGQAYEAEHGTLPNAPMWRMLEYRHSLNAARFDFYHPNVGLILEHGSQPHPVHQPPHGWIGHMRGPHEPPVVPAEPVIPIVPPGLPLIPLGPWETPHVVCQVVPPHTGPQVVPEPASIAMAAAVVAAWVMVAIGWNRLAARTKALK